MRWLDELWIYFAGFILWFSQEARDRVVDIAGGVIEGSRKIFRELGGFARGICSWSFVLLVIVLALVFISIWVSPASASVLKIIAIYILILWMFIIWIMLAISAGVVGTALELTGEVFREERETITSALRSPYSALAVIITILVSWAMAVIVWPGMPTYIGVSVTLLIIGLEMIDRYRRITNEEYRKKPRTLRMAKIWFFVAAIILAFTLTWRFAHAWLENEDNNNIVAVQYRDIKLGAELAAERKKLERGSDKLRKRASLEKFRKEASEPNAYPIIIALKSKQMLQTNAIDKLDKKVFFILSKEHVPSDIQARYGKSKCTYFESAPSQANPVPEKYIGPYDFFENIKGEKEGNSDPDQEAGFLGLLNSLYGSSSKERLPTEIIWPDGETWSLDHAAKTWPDKFFIPKGYRGGYYIHQIIPSATEIVLMPRPPLVAREWKGYVFDEKGYIKEKFELNQSYVVQNAGWILVASANRLTRTDKIVWVNVQIRKGVI